MAEEQLEWCKNAHVNEVLAKKQSLTTNDFLQYYSPWYALQKGVAWLICFASFLNHRSEEDERVSGPLTVSDICTATDRIVRYLQRQEFADELKALQTSLEKSSQHPFKGGILKRSKLEWLNPILIDRMLHVGGQIERSTISFSAKHPIILPQHHHVTDLIISHYRTQEGHMGPTLVLAAIRQIWWPVIPNCIDCQRNAKPSEQMMAPPPSSRVTPMNPPFIFVGVDYFGPILVCQGQSRVKQYGCLFGVLSIYESGPY